MCTLQTYEGGIGGEPGNEAHGGYTFCGLAAAALAGGEQALNLDSLTRWAASCQVHTAFTSCRCGNVTPCPVSQCLPNCRQSSSMYVFALVAGQN